MDYFPPKDDRARLTNYDYFQNIFLGEHFDAFKIKSSDFGKDYAPLKYITCNFGGLLSKLSADMLFEEYPKVTLPKGDMAWFEGLMRANKFKTQTYESGLQSSYRGDALYRIRAEDDYIILEDIQPSIYFPKLVDGNVRKEPKWIDLAWIVKLGGAKPQKAVRIERHHKGQIENLLYQLDERTGEIAGELEIDAYIPGVEPVIETKVDDFLVVHIPNYRIGSKHYGISDYNDLTSLMFAINNRMTKVDNILDKHGDPILAVPEGVLDEDGKVRKEAFGVIEVDSAKNEKGIMPQYIVWDAKLESAFSEIDKLVDFLFMFSETSQAAFGLDKGGQADSGRALKFKLLRTLAKSHRKQLYYDDGLKSLFYTAQKFAQANGLKTLDDRKIGKKPVMPEIKWADGVVNDPKEQIEYWEKRLDTETATRADVVGALDDMGETEAKKKVKEIDVELETEKKANQPEFNSKPFGVGLTKGE